MLAAEAVAIDDHHLARRDVAHEVRAEQLEGAGLRGDDPGAVLGLADRQRAEAHRIAHRDHRVLGQEHQRIGAADLAKRVGRPLRQRPLTRVRDEVDDRLGVGGGR